MTTIFAGLMPSVKHCHECGTRSLQAGSDVNAFCHCGGVREDWQGAVIPDLCQAGADGVHRGRPRLFPGQVLLFERLGEDVPAEVIAEPVHAGAQQGQGAASSVWSV
jgi:hypothetical protein